MAVEGGRGGGGREIDGRTAYHSLKGGGEKGVVAESEAPLSRLSCRNNTLSVHQYQ